VKFLDNIFVPDLAERNFRYTGRRGAFGGLGGPMANRRVVKYIGPRLYSERGKTRELAQR